MSRRNTVRSVKAPFPHGRVPFLREAQEAEGGGSGHPPPSRPSLCNDSASGGPALEDRVCDGLQGPEAMDPGQREAQRQRVPTNTSPPPDSGGAFLRLQPSAQVPWLPRQVASCPSLPDEVRRPGGPLEVPMEPSW